METLLIRSDEKFILQKKFDSRFMLPVSHFIQWKLDTGNWDDYNELYHATQLIEEIENDPEVWFESHCLIKNNALAGVLFIVGGKIRKRENRYEIKEEDKSLQLKYFHIIEKGQGYGSFWLSSVVMPHYRGKGFKQIYVNSSHMNSFAFYSRLGSWIADYEQWSDNRKYKRAGKSFLINL